MFSVQFTTLHKVALLVALPVSGVLLYFLLRNNDEDDYIPRERVVTSRHRVIEVKVPKHAAGAIIGTQGSQIKQIQDTTGSRVNFKDDTAEGAAERIVVIRGTDEQAQQAELMIRKIVAEIPPIIEETIYVPKKALGRIIGKGGETVRKISRVTKAKVLIDRDDDKSKGDMRDITLKGTAIAVVNAKDMIEDLLQEEEAYRARVALSQANRQQRNRGHTSNKSSTQNGTAVHDTGNSSEGHPSIQESVDEGASNVSDADNFSYNVKHSVWPSNSHDFQECYISAVEHPGHFWIQVINAESPKLDMMTDNMTKYYSMQAKCHRPPEYHIGDMVAAPFDGENNYFRARVLEVEGNKLDLYFVDYGDSELVHTSDVYPLRNDYLALPFQAFECCLANVEPVGEEWSEAAIIAFEDLVYVAKWKVIMAKKLGSEDTDFGHFPSLQLIDTNSSEDIDIASELVKREVAKSKIAAASSSSTEGCSTQPSDQDNYLEYVTSRSKDNTEVLASSTIELKDKNNKPAMASYSQKGFLGSLFRLDNFFGLLSNMEPKQIDSEGSTNTAKELDIDHCFNLISKSETGDSSGNNNFSNSNLKIKGRSNRSMNNCRGRNLENDHDICNNNIDDHDQAENVVSDIIEEDYALNVPNYEHMLVKNKCKKYGNSNELQISENKKLMEKSKNATPLILNNRDAETSEKKLVTASNEINNLDVEFPSKVDCCEKISTHSLDFDTYPCGYQCEGSLGKVSENKILLTQDSHECDRVNIYKLCCDVLPEDDLIYEENIAPVCNKPIHNIMYNPEESHSLFVKQEKSSLNSCGKTSDSQMRNNEDVYKDCFNEPDDIESEVIKSEIPIEDFCFQNSLYTKRQVKEQSMQMTGNNGQESSCDIPAEDKQNKQSPYIYSHLSDDTKSTEYQMSGTVFETASNVKTSKCLVSEVAKHALVGQQNNVSVDSLGAGGENITIVDSSDDNEYQSANSENEQVVVTVNSLTDITVNSANCQYQSNKVKNSQNVPMFETEKTVEGLSSSELHINQINKGKELIIDEIANELLNEVASKEMKKEIKSRLANELSRAIFNEVVDQCAKDIVDTTYLSEVSKSIAQDLAREISDELSNVVAAQVYSEDVLKDFVCEFALDLTSEILVELTNEIAQEAHCEIITLDVTSVSDQQDSQPSTGTSIQLDESDDNLNQHHSEESSEINQSFDIDKFLCGSFNSVDDKEDETISAHQHDNEIQDESKANFVDEIENELQDKLQKVKAQGEECLTDGEEFVLSQPYGIERHSESDHDFIQESDTEEADSVKEKLQRKKLKETQENIIPEYNCDVDEAAEHEEVDSTFSDDSLCNVDMDDSHYNEIAKMDNASAMLFARSSSQSDEGDSPEETFCFQSTLHEEDSLYYVDDNELGDMNDTSSSQLDRVKIQEQSFCVDSDYVDDNELDDMNDTCSSQLDGVEIEEPRFCVDSLSLKSHQQNNQNSRENFLFIEKGFQPRYPRSMEFAFKTPEVKIKKSSSFVEECPIFSSTTAYVEDDCELSDGRSLSFVSAPGSETDTSFDDTVATGDEYNVDSVLHERGSESLSPVHCELLSPDVKILEWDGLSSSFCNPLENQNVGSEQISQAFSTTSRGHPIHGNSVSPDDNSFEDTDRTPLNESSNFPHLLCDMYQSDVYDDLITPTNTTNNLNLIDGQGISEADNSCFVEYGHENQSNSNEEAISMLDNADIDRESVYSNDSLNLDRSCDSINNTHEGTQSCDTLHHNDSLVEGSHLKEIAEAGMMAGDEGFSTNLIYQRLVKMHALPDVVKCDPKLDLFVDCSAQTDEEDNSLNMSVSSIMYDSLEDVDIGALKQEEECIETVNPVHDNYANVENYDETSMTNVEEQDHTIHDSLYDEGSLTVVTQLDHAKEVTVLEDSLEELPEENFNDENIQIARKLVLDVHFANKDSMNVEPNIVPFSQFQNIIRDETIERDQQVLICENEQALDTLCSSCDSSLNGILEDSIENIIDVIQDDIKYIDESDEDDLQTRRKKPLRCSTPLESMDVREFDLIDMEEGVFQNINTNNSNNKMSRNLNSEDCPHNVSVDEFEIENECSKSTSDICYCMSQKNDSAESGYKKTRDTSLENDPMKVLNNQNLQGKFAKAKTKLPVKSINSDNKRLKSSLKKRKHLKTCPNKTWKRVRFCDSASKEHLLSPVEDSSDSDDSTIGASYDVVEFNCVQNRYGENVLKPAILATFDEEETQL